MIRGSAIVLAILLTLSLQLHASVDKAMVVVTRNYKPRAAGEKAVIVFDWKRVSSKAPFIGKGFTLTDGNFGKPVSYRVLDNNGDKQPDQVAFDFVFASDEPVFSFSISTNDKLAETIDGKATSDSRLEITYLSSFKQWSASGQSITNWPDKIIQSTMAFYPDPALLPLYAPGNYSYEYAFFLNATFLRWEETKNDAHLKYVKKWADRYLDSHGNLDPKHYNVQEYRLDDILPGRLFISLYQATGNEKYRNAADQLKLQLGYQPRTSEGGYWHKQIYPNQMWLDGIYMADVFSTQYAAAFNHPPFYDEAIKQIKLISEHTRDEATGLMYHGWDESYNKVWAHPENGTSPEFWSRAIGWYLMAIMDCMDYIPLDHPQRKVVGGMFKDLARSVLKYQDPETGLWYQVTNKKIEPANWIETSGSAMFAYAFAKGDRKGFLDRSYGVVAKNAFQSLVDNYVYFDEEGKIYLDGTVKIGTLNVNTSKGDFNYYATTERRINDYKGLGALLYLSLELDDLPSK